MQNHENIINEEKRISILNTLISSFEIMEEKLMEINKKIDKISTENKMI